MSDCIFCKIRDKEIPADIVFEDDKCVAFRDANPAAPVHILVIPRQHISVISEISDTSQDVVGHIYRVIAELAGNLGIAESGYRVVANCNSDGGQTVFHIHFHLLGGRQLGWPPV